MKKVIKGKKSKGMKYDKWKGGEKKMRDVEGKGDEEEGK